MTTESREAELSEVTDPNKDPEVKALLDGLFHPNYDAQSQVAVKRFPDGAKSELVSKGPNFMVGITQDEADESDNWLTPQAFSALNTRRQLRRLGR